MQHNPQSAFPINILRRWLDRSRSGRWFVPTALLILAASAYFAATLWNSAPPRDLAEHSHLQLNLREPDALIESRSLARLPRDLLEIPVLRDVLTEDFVFYYDSHPDRLGISGSLRRIIYEHHLQFQDELINEILDEPASVALWRGGTGKLAYAMLLIKRNGLSGLLMTLARVALDDTRLQDVGRLRVDGAELPLYSLQYAPDRSVLFSAVDDLLVVLSDPGMVLSDRGEKARLGRDATEALESVLDDQGLFVERFGLPKYTGQHRITISADYLSMGYRAFFPALAGFSLEKEAQGWTSRLAFDPVESPRDLDFKAIWRSMPTGASACVALPIDSRLPQALLQRVAATQIQQTLLTKYLKGPVGLCWYASSRLYTPLVVTPISGGELEDLDGVLGSLFEKMIGSIEPKLDTRRFPVQMIGHDGGKRWQRQVGSDFGEYPKDQFADPSLLKFERFFKVTLAREAEMILFSVDDRLVDQAIATLAKDFPPLLEQLPGNSLVPLYLAPEKLAPLLRQEALKSLPRSLEPVFRNAAQTQLLPKLEKLASYGKFALTLPSDTEPDEAWQWLPITWQSL